MALVPGTDDSQPGVVGGLVFETTDIEADVQTLRGRGVMPWGRSVQFADPDGNHLVLQTAASET